MHLIGIVETFNPVSGRFRLEAYRPHLEKRGNSLELADVPEGFWARLALWRSLRAADVVVLQRRLLNAWDLYQLRSAAARLIFDYDDAIYQRDLFAGKGTESTTRRRRFIHTVHAADVILAGNLTLQHEAFRFADPRKVHYLPTCVDLADYPRAEHRHRGPGVHLVWIGTGEMVSALEQSADLWNGLGRFLPGVQLKVISSRHPRFSYLTVLKAPWTEATEGLELATADIGVSWLPNDAWSRGECGLRVLQYMAAGLPVVANTVGVQAEMVRNGKTGFLVDKPSHWLEALRTLAYDPDLRRQMGEAGRRIVDRDYNVAKWAPRWLPLVLGRQLRKAA
jgi:glycosyltransferase involved in cell wall biosynthesis